MAKIIPSILSNMPPWPGKRLLVFLTDFCIDLEELAYFREINYFFWFEAGQLLVSCLFFGPNQGSDLRPKKICVFRVTRPTHHFLLQYRRPNLFYSHFFHSFYTSFILYKTYVKPSKLRYAIAYFVSRSSRTIQHPPIQHTYIHPSIQMSVHPAYIYPSIQHPSIQHTSIQNPSIQHTSIRPPSIHPSTHPF